MRVSALSPKSTFSRLTLLLCMLLAWACTHEEAGDTEADEPDEGVPGPVCDFDQMEDIASAQGLNLMETETGFICPPEDQDWYTFNTGQNGRIEVDLRMSAPITPVSPTYALIDDDGQSVANGASRNGKASGKHCVDPGRYTMVVRDASGSNQDLRNTYELTVRTGSEPDENEPNDETQMATPLAPDTPQTGFIACAGDVDWYRFEVPDRYIVLVRLTMPIAEFQPRVEMLDSEGNLLQQIQNDGASRVETDLRKTLAITTPGTYYFKVTDNNLVDADPTIPYEIQFSLTQDADPNEPNDELGEATVLNGFSCAEDWTDWLEFEGSYGTNGDVDWYRIPLNGCNPGLIEAEVTIDTAGLPGSIESKLQSAVAMIRGHEPSPCETDEECRQLNKECGDGWACAGFGNQCDQGRCSGAGYCLPEGICAATQVQRYFDPADVPDDPDRMGPPPNRAFLSAPILGDDVLYLRVSDFGGDAAAPERLYTLRIRTRSEPDLNEPSNLYMPDSLRRNQPVGQNRGIALRRNVVPVHLCGELPTDDPCLEPQPACNNGVDDDGDGLVDWPVDPGCTGYADDNEVGANEADFPQNARACHNAQDDDFDGLIDYPDDPDCVGASWRHEDPPPCPNGVDLRRIPRGAEVVGGDFSQLNQFAGSCGGAEGNEAVFTLTVSYPMTVTVGMQPQLGASMYVLDGCDQTTVPAPNELGCDSEAQTSFVFESPGVYFLVVDSNGRTEPFQLQIERTLADNICANPPPFEDEEMDVAPALGDMGIEPQGDIGVEDSPDLGTDGSVDAGVVDSPDQSVLPMPDAALADVSVPEDVSIPAIEDAALEPDMAVIDELDAGQSPSLDMGMSSLDEGVPEDASIPSDGTIAGDASMSDADIPVSPPTEFVPFCCGDDESDWVEGSLSYEHDQDWYAYPHPCPGEDCMVRIVYQLDGGPVDHLMQVYTGSNLWFDTIIPVEEKLEQEPANGQIGGVGAGDRCFYAFQGHQADGPYFYAISIRDLLPRRDWSADQKYRFCIEKVADGCLEPPCRRNPVTDSAGEVIREECSVR